MVEKLRRYELI